MSQLRYLTDNFSELDAAEHDLETNGVPRNHIHILSDNESALARHNLPSFSDWSKRDVVSFGLKGAMLGAILTLSILFGAVIYGVNDAGAWLVLAFVSIVTMGFCTWEGGLVGMNKLNHQFAKYREAIAKGEYLLVVDASTNQEERIARYSVESHPYLRAVD